ncbi:hypothetical protein ACFQX6_47470 [Streptosporangium lutulentum]
MHPQFSPVAFGELGERRFVARPGGGDERLVPGSRLAQRSAPRLLLRPVRSDKTAER